MATCVTIHSIAPPPPCDSEARSPPKTHHHAILITSPDYALLAQMLHTFIQSYNEAKPSKMPSRANFTISTATSPGILPSPAVSATSCAASAASQSG